MPFVHVPRGWYSPRGGGGPLSLVLLPLCARTRQPLGWGLLVAVLVLWVVLLSWRTSRSVPVILVGPNGWVWGVPLFLWSRFRRAVPAG